MKKKKILTANLEKGMVTAEAVYNFSNHLIISSNTTLTTDIIEKLKYYSVGSVKILVPEKGEKIFHAVLPPGSPAQNETGSKDASATGYMESIGNNTDNREDMTYFEKIQASQEFKEFEAEFNSCVNEFRDELNDLIIKNSDGIVDNMLKHIDSIFSKARNPLHLLDMMQCMRNYDDLTYAHSMNVALICNITGIWLKLSNDEMPVLIMAGLLHDIGKLKIPPEIIKKPGRLTDEEFAVIKKHPEYGYEILKHKNLDSRVVQASYQHHERYNGRGYPCGLTGSSISFFSSIVAVADVYDAMTSDRSYRKGMCPFAVLEHMEREKDSYNPYILHTFINHTAESYINNEVELSNGEKGRVILLSKDFLSRPIVVTDNNSYDLSKTTDIHIKAII